MAFNNDLSKYGVLVVGLLIAGGFAFGGIASYAGMINPSGGQGQGASQDFDAELPASTYTETPYNLSIRQMRVLAFRNDVVFVNVLYSDQPLDRSQFARSMSGRAYVQVVNESEVSVDENNGITETPVAIVVGGTQRGGVSAVRDVSEEGLREAACGGLRSWSSSRGSVVSYCQQ